MVKKNKEEETESIDITEGHIDSLTGLKKEFLKKYGNSSIRLMSEIENEPVRTISTGSIRLDIALKAPLCPGVHEIAGSEGAGKTTMSLEAAAQAQKEGMQVFYINMERGLTKSLAQGIFGLNREKMEVINPQTGHQALDMIDDIVRQIPRSFIILDSVTALVSDDEIAKSSEEDTMGMLGRMLSKFLKKNITIISDNESVLLFLNQLRDNLGYGAKEVTTGGRAIKFYSHSRIFLKAPKDGQITIKRGDENVVIGQTVQAHIVKNRDAIPFRTVEVELLYGKGFYRSLEILKYAEELGVIDKEGSWYSMGGKKIGQGQKNACDFIESDKELFESIKQQIFDMYK